MGTMLTRTLFVPPLPDDVKIFLETAPLYRSVECRILGSSPETYDKVFPKKISLHCSNCNQTTNWENITLYYSKIGSLEDVTYKCANCDKNTVVYYLWGRVKSAQQIVLQKVGQYPAQEIKPSKELEKALGTHAPLYTKGMTCRNHSFGIGAHAYFRRLVEDMTDEMLDFLADAMEQAGEAEDLVQKIRDTKKAVRYEDKIQFAAGAIPTSLRPGGQNPFSLLHDLLSRGLHRLSDEECIDVVDDIQKVLEFIFVELKANVEQRKAYSESLKLIAEKAAKARSTQQT